MVREGLRAEGVDPAVAPGGEDQNPLDCHRGSASIGLSQDLAGSGVEGV